MDMLKSEVHIINIIYTDGIFWRSKNDSVSPDTINIQYSTCRTTFAHSAIIVVAFFCLLMQIRAKPNNVRLLLGVAKK